jgi:hypothetical protein
MNLWHKEHANERAGAHAKLSGNLKTISGNCTNVWGQTLISGCVTQLKGCLTGLVGSSEGLSGEVSRLRGNMSELTGVVDRKLIGDVSGLHGDVGGVWGNADGLRGSVAELTEQGKLWLKDQTLTLEIFASRFNLPMEFLDNSGHPALIAFHALQGTAVHWITVRNQSAEGFIVGPFSVISHRFPGQEIIKVAIPSDAKWQLQDEYDTLTTSRIYAFEQLATPVHTAMP